MPLISSLFSTLERLGGRPRELFTVARGISMWRYTSGRKPITITYGATNVTWAPAPISRQRFAPSGDAKGIVATVRVALLTDVAQALLEEHTSPTVVGIHKYQDTATVVPVLVAYGRVVHVKADGEWLQFDVATDDAGLGVEFPSAKIERFCQWHTYSPFCGVIESDFSFATTIVSIDRSTIIVASVSGNPDGYYRFGQLIVGPTSAKERVFVSEQIGTTFTIFGQLPTGVAVSDAVTLVAGDDQLLATCKAKFANVDRFLGFDQLPQVDPMKVGLS
jgi:Phage conserved hypothetical protein BR0599